MQHRLLIEREAVIVVKLSVGHPRTVRPLLPISAIRERLLVRGATGCSGSFTPIRTAAPTGVSTVKS